MNIIIKRTGLVIVIVVTLMALIIGIRVKNTYITEGNAGIILKSIVQMDFQKKDIIKLDDSTYLTKTNADFINPLMKNKGWELEDRYGSDYWLKISEGKTKIVSCRLVYSSNYLIWDLDR